MASLREYQTWTISISRQAVTIALTLAVVFALIVVATEAAQAQTLTVLYDFTGGSDGSQPTGGLAMDTTGNLYGVTAFGGSMGMTCGACGTVFELKRKNSGSMFHSLYNFTGGSDGSEPLAPLIIGADQNLYGTSSSVAWLTPGAVFSLNPGSLAVPLYTFMGGSDGVNPGWGALVFDNLGNLYGTTTNNVTRCGGPNCGNVYELMRSGSSWIEIPLYPFTGGSDGGQPFGGVVFDRFGNLVGVAAQGGVYGAGVVFKLTRSGSTWSETVLYNFQGGNDGSSPIGGVVFDRLGNIYGTTALGGPGGGGTVFMLTPSTPYWKETILHTFTGGEGPTASLTMDEAGSLYGTTYADGAYGLGSVFELTPDLPHAVVSGWKFTTLHDFTGGSDGFLASGSITLDSMRNLYSVTWAGGAHGSGTVFQIKP